MDTSDNLSKKVAALSRNLAFVRNPSQKLGNWLRTTGAAPLLRAYEAETHGLSSAIQASYTDKTSELFWLNPAIPNENLILLAEILEPIAATFYTGSQLTFPDLLATEVPLSKIPKRVFRRDWAMAWLTPIDYPMREHPHWFPAATVIINHIGFPPLEIGAADYPKARENIENLMQSMHEDPDLPERDRLLAGLNGLGRHLAKQCIAQATNIRSK